MSTQILHGDVRETLRQIPDGAVQCCVTSPPYWGLRSYLKKGHPDKAREIGQEKTPEAYVETMVGVFREVKRCLHDSGTLFLNCGDSYFGGGRGGNPEDSPHRKQATNRGSLVESPNWRVAGGGEYGSDGTPQPDWQCRDCASGNPCDEHRDALLSHIRRTCDHPALAQVAEPLLQIRARMEGLRGHLPIAGSTRPTRKGQSAIATLDSMRSEVHAAALLLAAAESNLRESSPQQSDYFRLLGMLSACRSSLDSFAAGVPRFVHTLGALGETPDCTVDTVSPCAELASHIQCTSECCSLVVSWLGYIKAQRSTSQALKPKDLCGIPWRLVLALQADGWYWRSCIVWHKKSCMPESVTDRPTNSWEPIFLLAKSQRYFYDAEAVKEQVAECSIERAKYSFDASKDRNNTARGGSETFTASQLVPESGLRNQRNVWSLSPEPYSEAHFATFPTEIPRRAILAGTSARGCCPKCYAPWERVVEKESKCAVPRGSVPSSNRHNVDGSQPQQAGVSCETRTVGWEPGCVCEPRLSYDQNATRYIPCTVLDPFGGSGTTGAVALELGRNAILCELNDAYLPLINRRTNVTKGLQLA